MKHKFSTNRFSYGLTTRTHRNVRTWVKPHSLPERSKRAIENILRWEDDGGPVSEARDQLPHVTEDHDHKVVGIIAQADVATRLDQPEKTSQMVKEISRK